MHPEIIEMLANLPRYGILYELAQDLQPSIHQAKLQKIRIRNYTPHRGIVVSGTSGSIVTNFTRNPSSAISNIWLDPGFSIPEHMTKLTIADQSDIRVYKNHNESLSQLHPSYSAIRAQLQAANLHSNLALNAISSYTSNLLGDTSSIYINPKLSPVNLFNAEGYIPAELVDLLTNLRDNKYYARKELIALENQFKGISELGINKYSRESLMLQSTL
jgi:hypothetical protein